MAADADSPPRTIPPWVRSVTDTPGEDHEKTTSPTALLPRTPQSIRPATHNSQPSPRPNAPAGRRYDYARQAMPPMPSGSPTEVASRWRSFALASQYPNPPSTANPSEVVSRDWMRENMKDLDAPWEPEEPTTPDPEKQPGFWLFTQDKRKRRLSKIHRTLMRNPYIPLIIRLNVLIFSAAALGLSARIFHLIDRKKDGYDCDAGSSTYMAIIVDVIAIVYLCYITYDEYTARPLGLRNPKSKLRLIFFDLLFIVFDSANLSIAFQSLTDSTWACVQPQGDENARRCYAADVCTKQKALTAVLLIALVAWLSTFAISTLRIVERVTR
ncbi:uncharacterized protein IWZ02DRAFT_314523 [Phyllosticta citriasiana]|uniref:Regulator of phospholipase D SRF1 n=3 Tax=Phyllosticta TaxID=121621 RepID=A0ABR1MI30_9PEZI